MSFTKAAAVVAVAGSSKKKKQLHALLFQVEAFLISRHDRHDSKGRNAFDLSILVLGKVVVINSLGESWYHKSR
jgi:hypothetical protein